MSSWILVALLSGPSAPCPAKLGLQVVARQGSARATFLTSAIRNLLWIIPLVNLVMGVTGLYLLFHDGGGRHWGDRLADTRVVKV